MTVHGMLASVERAVCDRIDVERENSITKFLERNVAHPCADWTSNCQPPLTRKNKGGTTMMTEKKQESKKFLLGVLLGILVTLAVEEILLVFCLIAYRVLGGM